MNPNTEITGIVLAGGKSSRMGRDKGLIEVNGTPLVSRAIYLLQRYCGSVIISSGNSAYDRFGAPRIVDEIPNMGPVGGMISCIKKTETPWLLFLGCDMPLLDGEVLDLLVAAHREEKDAVVIRHNGEAEPLCGLYSRKALPHFEAALRGENYRLKDILNKLKTQFIDLPTPIFVRSFRSMNTPDEFRVIETLIS
ncbi:MAG: molybdenum cofactor guanylyltransferase [Bacteroidia bacterium]|nr:molybdenum cofactor guanylyltransferase [Bacteroidia bacterium]